MPVRRVHGDEPARRHAAGKRFEPAAEVGCIGDGEADELRHARAFGVGARDQNGVGVEVARDDRAGIRADGLETRLVDQSAPQRVIMLLPAREPPTRAQKPWSGS